MDAVGTPPRSLLSVDASIPWLLLVLPVNSCLQLLLLQQICFSRKDHFNEAFLLIP